MKDLAFLGLKTRSACSGDSNEQRIELRLASTDAFVAWFQLSVRLNAGERIVSTNAQLVQRDELSDDQLAAAKAWIHEQTLATI